MPFENPWRVAIHKPDGTPLSGASVWLTTDEAGSAIAAGPVLSSVRGIASFLASDGLYYLWRTHGEYEFANPVSIYILDASGDVNPANELGSAIIISADNTVTISYRLRLSDTVWDDVRVPILSVKLGGSKDPDFAKVFDDGAGSQGVFTYLFDKSVEEEVYFVLQLPHSWKAGTNIRPHVHWFPAANGAAGQFVRWGLEYTWASIGEVFGATTTIYTDASSATTATIPGDDPLIAGKHYMSLLPEIDATGKGWSSMLICRLFRDATDSADTYNNDAGLLEFDCHTQMDKLGSDNVDSDD